MFEEFIQLINGFKGVLGIVLPLVVFALSIIVTFSILKWGSKLNMGIKYIFKNPFFIVFWITILGLLIYSYVAYIQPLFK